MPTHARIYCTESTTSTVPKYATPNDWCNEKKYTNMTKLLLHHIFCTGTFLQLNLFTFAHFYSQIFTKNLPLKCCAKYTTPRPYKSKYTPKQHTPFKCILPHDVFFHGVLYCIRTTKYYTNPRKYFLKYSSISMQPTDGTEHFITMHLSSKQLNQQPSFNKKV